MGSTCGTATKEGLTRRGGSGNLVDVYGLRRGQRPALTLGRFTHKINALRRGSGQSSSNRMRDARRPFRPSDHWFFLAFEIILNDRKVLKNRLTGSASEPVGAIGCAAGAKGERTFHDVCAFRRGCLSRVDRTKGRPVTL